jgi:hypothetical protein
MRAAQRQLLLRPCYNLFLLLPNVLPPRPCCNLFLLPPNKDIFLPNTSATAAPLPSSDAAMLLLFKRAAPAVIFCHCHIAAG